VSYGRPSVKRMSVMMNDLEQGEIVEDEADAASTSDVGDDRSVYMVLTTHPSRTWSLTVAILTLRLTKGVRLCREGKRRRDSGPASSSFASLLDALSPSSSAPHRVLTPEGRSQRESRQRERDEPGGSGRSRETLKRQKEPVRHDLLDYASQMRVPKMDLETDPAVHMKEVRCRDVKDEDE
jgi:hypothetical protein